MSLIHFYFSFLPHSQCHQYYRAQYSRVTFHAFFNEFVVNSASQLLSYITIHCREVSMYGPGACAFDAIQSDLPQYL